MERVVRLTHTQRVLLKSLLLKEKTRLGYTLRLTLYGDLDKRVHEQMALIDNTLTELED